MMKFGKWVIGMVVLSLCFGGIAFAQDPPPGSAQNPPCEIHPYQPNELCLHNGVEFYTNGPYHKWSTGNRGGGNFFPSFTHQAGIGGPAFQCQYMWKIEGWCFYGMMGGNANDTWYWETTLANHRDNPYSLNMSWDYPKVFCDGLTTHYSFCSPIFGATVNSSLTCVGGQGYVLPSSAGGTVNQNIFAICCGYVVIPGTLPYYCYGFVCERGTGCEYPWTVPSSDSIYAFVWTHQNPLNGNQYICLDGDCPDCLGNPGNKGRNYTIISDLDNGYYWMWLNSCGGTNVDWGICLLVCDVVTLPVNRPGGSNTANPYVGYGFDLGPAIVTPYISSGCVVFDWCILANNPTAVGNYRTILGELAFLGPHLTYNVFCCWRIPFPGPITDLFLLLNLGAVPLPGYPAMCYASCSGANTMVFLPVQPDPLFLCLELDWYSVQHPLLGANTPGPASAAFMQTFF
jgi:hypothetical protein